MDPQLYSYIRRHYNKSLPELKLDLMKKGFSSYQIENALENVRINRKKRFLRVFLIVLFVLVFFAVIGLVFVSFIKPAEEFAVMPVQKDINIDLPSEKPVIPAVDEEKSVILEDNKSEKLSQIKKYVVEKKEVSLESKKSLEEIKQISNTRPSEALEFCIDLEQKDLCVSLVAKNVNRPVYCENIKDQDIRDDCFFFFGQSDSRYCEQIYSGVLRNSCFSLAEINKNA